MKLADLDLNLLVAFDSVFRLRSMTAAADEVGITQPALSNAINRLRKRFRDPLFVRTSKGMAPTPAAMRMARALQEALALIRAVTAEVDAFDPATSTRTFSFAMSDIGERVLVPALLARCAALAPHVSLRVRQLPLEATREALESGAADLAVGYLPGLRGGLYQQRLFRERYVTIARGDHPRIGKELSLRQFAAERHALVVSPGTGHEAMQRRFAQGGLAERIALYVENFGAIPTVVASTDLLVTVPSRLARSYQQFVSLKVLQPPIRLPDFDVKQYWHERFNRDPANRWLRTQMAALFAEAGG